jgi:HSP20 family protein
MSLGALTRWDPFRDLVGLQDRVSRLMNEGSFGLTAAEGIGAWLPPVDIHEDGDKVILRAEIPGVSRDDIDVKIENGTITLRGEKKQEKEVDSSAAYRVERYYGSFSRSFVLPTSIDADHIRATYKDGVLEVILPKQETAKPRKIKVLES